MTYFPYLWFSLLFLFACTSPAPAPSNPNTTEPVPLSRPEITIDDVTAANPVVIKGTARSFENNVVIRVRDARGAVIRETFTTSRGDSGQHNPFTAEVYLTRDPGGKIMAEALEYSAKDGSERSLTSRTVPYEVAPVDSTLFFPRNDCAPMYPYRRKMPKSVGAARLLVEALAQGPTSSETVTGATNPFPRGSEVRGVNLRDGVLTVDFNERLQNVGGSCAVTAIRSSVETTLKALPNVRQVVITANGSRDLALQP